MAIGNLAGMASSIAVMVSIGSLVELYVWAYQGTILSATSSLIGTIITKVCLIMRIGVSLVRAWGKLNSLFCLGYNLEVFRSVCSLFLKFKFSAKGRSEVPEGLKQKPGWIVRVNPNLDYSQLDYPQLDYPHLD